MDLSSLTPDKQVKLQYWLDVIRQCRALGLTNQIWCEQHDISLKSYYYWLSKIRKLALEELPRKKNGIHMYRPTFNCFNGIPGWVCGAFTSGQKHFPFHSCSHTSYRIHNSGTLWRHTSAQMLENILKAAVMLEIFHMWRKSISDAASTDMRKQLNGLLDIIQYNFKLILTAIPYSCSVERGLTGSKQSITRRRFLPFIQTVRKRTFLQMAADRRRSKMISGSAAALASGRRTRSLKAVSEMAPA